MEVALEAEREVAERRVRVAGLPHRADEQPVHHAGVLALARRIHDVWKIARGRRAPHPPRPEPERRQHRLEARELGRIRRLVHAMQRGPARLDEQVRDRAIRGEHRFLDGAMRDVAGGEADRAHAAVRVYHGLGLRELEVERAGRDAALAQARRQRGERAERVGELGVERRLTLHHGRRRFVGELRARADPARDDLQAAERAVLVDRELDRQRETLLLGPQRAEIARQPLGQHGHHAIRQIDAVAALPRLAVERRRRRHELRHVRDRDPEPEARAAALREHRVVVIARAQRVDRHEGQRPEVEPRDGVGRGLRRLELAQTGWRKAARQPMEVAHPGEVEVRVAHAAEAPPRAHAPARLEAHRDDLAGAEPVRVAQRRTERAVVGVRPQLEPSPAAAHHGALRCALPRRRARLAATTRSGPGLPPLHRGSVDAVMGAA